MFVFPSPLPRMPSDGTGDVENWWLPASCFKYQTLRSWCTQRSTQYSGMWEVGGSLAETLALIRVKTVVSANWILWIIISILKCFALQSPSFTCPSIQESAHSLSHSCQVQEGVWRWVQKNLPHRASPPLIHSCWLYHRSDLSLLIQHRKY